MLKIYCRFVFKVVDIYFLKYVPFMRMIEIASKIVQLGNYAFPYISYWCLNAG